MKLIVSKQDNIYNYLISNLNVKKTKIKQYLKFGDVFVNNNLVYKHSYLVKENDIIEIKEKNRLCFDIIYEDKYIVVVNKPSGLLCVSDDKSNNSLYNMLREYYNSINIKIYVVHRLDKDTSGIVIFSKSIKVRNMLQDNWNNYVKLREYYAVVHGKVNKKSDRIVQYLKTNKLNIVYVSKDGKLAVTNYDVIKSNSNYSVLKINIETGRQNQIRVALKSIDHPILGDRKYGIKDGFSRLYLHASKLVIYYPILKKDIEFRVDVPNEFNNIM